MFQNGGRKNRSIKDNWIATMAILDRNKELNQNTYILFADAEKCFDRLWLEDCVIDINRVGMREREAVMLYNMNEKARIMVETPCGNTETFETERTVKQGTIFGTQLCCSSTAQIDKIGQSKMETYLSELSVGTLIFVDDIEAVGSKSSIEEAGRNLRTMEEKKGFRFNTDKTKYMIVRTGKKKVEEANIEVKMGKVERTNEYKYLGNWIGEKGTVEIQTEKKMKKSYRWVSEIN